MLIIKSRCEQRSQNNTDNQPMYILSMQAHVSQNNTYEHQYETTEQNKDEKNSETGDKRSWYKYLRSTMTRAHSTFVSSIDRNKVKKLRIPNPPQPGVIALNDAKGNAFKQTRK